MSVGGPLYVGDLIGFSFTFEFADSNEDPDSVSVFVQSGTGDVITPGNSRISQGNYAGDFLIPDPAVDDPDEFIVTVQCTGVGGDAPGTLVLATAAYRRPLG